MVDLRQYQQKGVGDIRQAFLDGYMAPCFVLPTGGGKTIILAYITASAVQKGNPVLILVHRFELMRQTQQKLQQFGIRCGMISPKFTPDYDAPVQVAMVQTLVNRLDKYPRFGLVITDECHHVAANTYQKITKNYNCFELGVTATPIRADGKGLGKDFGGNYDVMILGPSTRQLMDDGFLVEPEIYLPPNDFDRQKLKKSGTDFNKKQVAESVGKRSITGDACDHYLSYTKYMPGVVFCTNVDHAQSVAAEYRDRGIISYCVEGSMDDRSRARILNGLGDGSVHVVTSCDVISEGFDIPNIIVGQSLRPTESKGLHLQQIGRILRPAPNKPTAYWFDHVGNCVQWVKGQMVMVHGFPDDEQHWSLEGEIPDEKGPATPGVKICSSCFMAYKVGQSICPHCGATKSTTPKPIKIKAGQLEKVDKAALVLQKQQLRREENEARTVDELEALAKKRGYHSGWVQHKIKTREAAKAKH